MFGHSDWDEEDDDEFDEMLDDEFSNQPNSQISGQPTLPSFDQSNNQSNNQFFDQSINQFDDDEDEDEHETHDWDTLIMQRIIERDRLNRSIAQALARPVSNITNPSQSSERAPSLPQGDPFHLLNQSTSQSEEYEQSIDQAIEQARNALITVSNQKSRLIKLMAISDQANHEPDDQTTHRGLSLPRRALFQVPPFIEREYQSIHPSNNQSNNQSNNHSMYQPVHSIETIKQLIDQSINQSITHRAVPWNRTEQSNLMLGVLHHVQTELIKQSINQIITQSISQSEKDRRITEIIARMRNQFNNQSVNETIKDVDNIQIPYALIARSYVPTRSINQSNNQSKNQSIDCMMEWVNRLDPRINHSKWTSSQSEDLSHIAERYGARNWLAIAQEINQSNNQSNNQSEEKQSNNQSINQNRTPINCLRHYNQSINQAVIQSADWSLEEDDALRQTVVEYGARDWRLISIKMNETVKKMITQSNNQPNNQSNNYSINPVEIQVADPHPSDPQTNQSNKKPAKKTKSRSNSQSTNQSNNQSNSQTVNQSNVDSDDELVLDPLTQSVRRVSKRKRTIRQPIINESSGDSDDQLINQTTNQSINRSSRRPAKRAKTEPINQPVSDSDDELIIESIIRATNQSNNPSNDQLVEEPNSHSNPYRYRTPQQCFQRWKYLSVKQSTKQSNNQSSNQSIRFTHRQDLRLKLAAMAHNVSFNQPVNQSNNQAVTQLWTSVSRFVTPSIIQTIDPSNQSVSQTTNQPIRSDTSCRSHFYHVINPKIDRSEEWSVEEDESIKQAINQYGLHNWTMVARSIEGGKRSAKQVQYRWKVLQSMDQSNNQSNDQPVSQLEQYNEGLKEKRVRKSRLHSERKRAKIDL